MSLSRTSRILLIVMSRCVVIEHFGARLLLIFCRHDSFSVVKYSLSVVLFRGSLVGVGFMLWLVVLRTPCSRFVRL
ncbi:unnamed protein product [Amoebophrya sp. A25]|nr:unnamed protein product [Amoebophrya sp. A25]|eukprot:GSA25T00027094001.1